MYDNAGNRKPKPLDATVVAALSRGQSFNPIIHEEGVHHYILVPAAGIGHRKQYLGKALEGHRFALGCDCDEGHCFYETLHNFTHRRDRLCKFCSSITGMWEAADKKKISEPENQLMARMKDIAVDTLKTCRFKRSRVRFLAGADLPRSRGHSRCKPEEGIMLLPMRT